MFYAVVVALLIVVVVVVAGVSQAKKSLQMRFSRQSATLAVNKIG